MNFFDERYPGKMSELGAMFFGEKSFIMSDYVKNLVSAVFTFANMGSTIFVGRGIHLILPRDRVLAVRTIFLNMSLACDYRIVANDTTFQKPYFELEMLPKGSGPFFLCNLLGYSKTKQLLMSEKEISASEALEIGIVDQVVPHDKLEETAIQTAQDWTQRSTRSLIGIKRLLNYTMKDLTDYLNFESAELLKIIGFF